MAVIHKCNTSNCVLYIMDGKLLSFSICNCVLKAFTTSLDAFRPTRGRVELPLTANCCLPDVYQETNTLFPTSGRKAVQQSKGLAFLRMLLVCRWKCRYARHACRWWCRAVIFICQLPSNGPFLVRWNFRITRHRCVCAVFVKIILILPQRTLKDWKRLALVQ